MTASVIGAAQLALVLTIVKTADGVAACQPAGFDCQLRVPSSGDLDSSSSDESDSTVSEGSCSTSSVSRSPKKKGHV